VLVIIVGALAIGASIVLGFFAFIVLSGIVLVFAAIIGIRLWWFNRKLQRASSGATRSAGVIEGEYREVKKDGENRRD